MPQPMYLQIAEDLRSKIDSGDLARGSQLPTEQELGQIYSASRNTIRDAIKRLLAQQLIETKPGLGTFVTYTIDPYVTVLTRDPGSGLAGGEGAAYLSEVSQQRREASFGMPTVEVLSPPPEVAKRLGVEPSSPVVARHQERFIDRVPWSLQTSFYPMDFVDRGATQLLMARDISDGVVPYLAAQLGIRETGYRDWITARLPEDREQAFFAIGHDAAVFEIYRIGFDQHKVPMRLTVSVYPFDRNQFIIEGGGELPDLQHEDGYA
jgi:GntR family transcriptional regulator